MGFTLADKIFAYFGVNEKRQDTYKDVNGKGINERFQECFGEDYDEHNKTLIDDGLDHLIVPQTAYAKFLIYLEYMVGIPVQLDENNEPLRRKLLALNDKITLTKGTLTSYKILLNLIGISGIVVTLPDVAYGFDSPTTFDDDSRRFDGKIFCCTHYSIDLTGTPTLDADLEAKIKKIIYYLQPVNSEIDSLTYNTVTISLP